MPHGIDNTVAKTAKSCVAQVYVNQKVLHVLCYTVSMIKRPVILVILDGFGIPPATTASSSPFKAASCPTIHEMEKHYPFTTLQASGIAVGLLMGQAGNSEVGHLTMGAGRTLYHHLPRIITAIEDRSFLKNEAFLSSISHAEERKSTLHLMGLFSSGSVHAYRDHFYALIELVGGKDIPVKLHLFSDGKDSPTREFAENLQELKQYLNEEGYSNVDIASLIGRFYAMDRDAQWERIHKAYQCLIGEQALSFSNPIKYVEDSYQKGVEECQTVVLIIDEAHKLTPETLEALRVLLNYETNEVKLLQLVLLGQIELLPVLKSMPDWSICWRMRLKKCLLILVDISVIKAMISTSTVMVIYIISISMALPCQRALVTALCGHVWISQII